MFNEGQLRYTKLYTSFSLRRLSVIALIVIFILASTLVLAHYLNCDLSLFVKNYQQGLRFLSKFISPDISFIPKLIKPLIETLLVALLASFTGLILAFPLAGLMSVKLSPHKACSSLFSASSACLRTIPALVWAAILVSLFGIGLFSAYLALSLIMCLQGSKLLREHIDTLPELRVLSSSALGLGFFKGLYNVFLPLLKYELASVYMILFESGIRGASILGLVGAGGLGQVLQVQLAYLRYDRLSLVILLLFALIAVCDLLSHLIRQKIAELSLSSASGEAGTNAKSLDQLYKRFVFSRARLPIFGLASLLILLAAIVFFVVSDWESIVRGMAQLKALAQGFMQPDFAYAPKAFGALVEGLAMAALASIVAACLALCFSVVVVPYCLQEKGSAKLAYLGAKLLANFLRSFPSIVLAIVFLVVLGPGAFSGVLALICYTTGILMRYFFEGFISYCQDHKMSFQALGLSSFKLYLCIILREFRSYLINLTLYRFESNIRNAAVLGMVGAGGIGALLETSIRYRVWDRVALLLYGLILASLILDNLALQIRKRLN